jgi:hypothetical protein
MSLIIKSSDRIVVVNPTPDFFETTTLGFGKRKKEVTPAQKAQDMAYDKFGNDVEEIKLTRGSEVLLDYTKPKPKVLKLKSGNPAMDEKISFKNLGV